MAPPGSLRLTGAYAAAMGWAGFVFVVAVFFAAAGRGLTYDEATYVDLSSHPLHSSYYPDDVFLRHPPLAFATLWVTMQAFGDDEGVLRMWAVVWSLAGLFVLAAAVQACGAPASLVLVPAVTLPMLLPLVSVSMYPPMFFFMCLAAWGRAAERRVVEVVAWNLGVLTHELVLLPLAASLLPAFWRVARTERPWHRAIATGLRATAAYPAAWAWGLLLLAQTVLSSDTRTGDVFANAFAPAALELWRLKVAYTLVILLACTPAIVMVGARALRRPGDGPVWGAAAFGTLVVVLSPLYRYLAAPLPLLVGGARPGDTGALVGRRGVAVVLSTALACNAAAFGMLYTGHDPVNDPDTPFFADYGQAVALVAPGDVIGTRSPPALAYYLQQQGWDVVRTGPDGPSLLVLRRGDQNVTILRVPTPGSAHADGSVDAPLLEEQVQADTFLLSRHWSSALGRLEEAGWEHAGSRGGLVRLEAP